jgi:preprotein translocase subunit SecB
VIVEGIYEVVLDITVTAKHNEKTAFLVELKQAGVFSLSGFSEEDLVTMLNAYCPETLFPFAREAIAELIGKGGFPQFILQPVNFNALLAQQAEQQAVQQAEQSGQEKAH